MSILLSSTLANESSSYYALAGTAGAGVSQIVAGNANIVVSPSGGTGVVTLSVPNAANEFVTGMILMFNGVTAPTGWQYCDGTNGTPDLRDRFVICSTATFPLNTSGGSLTSTLVLANLPDHIHGQNGSISANSGDLGSGGQSFCGPGGNTTGISSPGWTPTPTPVSILPPYYALAYIMKL